MGDGAPRDTLGMTEEEMLALLDELLRENAAEAAAAKGTSVAAELDSPGFAAARAAMTYAVHLIAANNAFLARHLLDLGVIPGAGAAADAPPNEAGA
jgi:hypothetical protein